MQKKIMIASVFAGLIISNIAQARDNLSIAGSSTVLPFARLLCLDAHKNNSNVNKLYIIEVYLCLF